MKSNQKRNKKAAKNEIMTNKKGDEKKGLKNMKYRAIK